MEVPPQTTQIFTFHGFRVFDPPLPPYPGGTLFADGFQWNKSMQGQRKGAGFVMGDADWLTESGMHCARACDKCASHKFEASMHQARREKRRNQHAFPSLEVF